MVSFFKFLKFERDDAKTLAKAILIGGSIICLLITGLFWLSSMFTRFLGLPASLNLHPILTAAGWVMLVASAGLGLWLFRYRSPTSMIVSTYFTFVKMFTRAPVSGLGGRTEPLIVQGPQKYVRHPLYLSAASAFLGWALITNSTSTLVGVVFIVLWLVFVQIPFEEKELRALFGDQYVRYSKDVPMLIPLTKTHRNQ